MKRMRSAGWYGVVACTVAAYSGVLLAGPSPSGSSQDVAPSRPAAAQVAAPPVLERVTSRHEQTGIDGLDGVRATFWIAAPVAATLELLWDVEQFRRVFPEIRSVRVLRRTARELDVEFGVDAVLAEVKYTLRRTLDPEAAAIRWMEIGGDLEHVRGSWQVHPTETAGVSKVVYESYVSVANFIPESLYRDLAIGKLNALAQRVRALVASKETKGPETSVTPAHAPPTAAP